MPFILREAKRPLRVKAELLGEPYQQLKLPCDPFCASDDPLHMRCTDGEDVPPPPLFLCVKIYDVPFAGMVIQFTASWKKNLNPCSCCGAFHVGFTPPYFISQSVSLAALFQTCTALITPGFNDFITASDWRLDIVIGTGAFQQVFPPFDVCLPCIDACIGLSARCVWTLPPVPEDRRFTFGGFTTPFTDFGCECSDPRNDPPSGANAGLLQSPSRDPYYAAQWLFCCDFLFENIFRGANALRAQCIPGYSDICPPVDPSPIPNRRLEVFACDQPLPVTITINGIPVAVGPTGDPAVQSPCRCCSNPMQITAQVTGDGTMCIFNPDPITLNNIYLDGPLVADSSGQAELISADQSVRAIMTFCPPNSLTGIPMENFVTITLIVYNCVPRGIGGNDCTICAVGYGEGAFDCETLSGSIEIDFRSGLCTNPHTITPVCSVTFNFAGV